MFFVFSFSFSAKKKKVASKFTTHLCPFSPVLGLRLSFHCAYLAFLFFLFFFFSFTTVPPELSVCAQSLSPFFSLSLFTSLRHAPLPSSPLVSSCASTCVLKYRWIPHPLPFSNFFLSLSLSLSVSLSFSCVCLLVFSLSFFFFFPCCTYHGFLPRSHLPCDYPHYLLPIVVFTLTSFARLSVFFLLPSLSLHLSLACLSVYNDLNGSLLSSACINGRVS